MRYRRALPAVLACLACLACGAGSRQSGRPGSDSQLGLSLEVFPPTERGHSARLVIAPVVALRAVEAEFQLPEGCTVVAGALRRSFPGLDAGTDVEQGLGFTCPPGGGERRLAVTVKATAGTDGVVTRSVEADVP